ncbi:AMP-binding protein [Bacillus luteolus]|uniref:AMP-binding protein n=1 Tax=Litchfieldia luteola TaxID=682179 RepID=A0ABR9QIV8_9BACI|nr:AMP-binding protein [Cytobacillus luteolus]MBE4908434.1 AMP-binding protein [Cytobacillus luteolus]MBP1941280.1 phenylacetate-CoA ligase [Cytobacillus luteolus]
MSSIQELISYAYEHAEGFKVVMEVQELTPDRITTVEDLVKIPVLKKDRLPDLQQENLPFAGLSTRSTAEMARVFMSPGPIYDPQTHEDDFWRFSEALEAAGFNENDIVQNTFSYHLSPAGFMFDSALRKLGATVIPAGTGNRELQLQVMKDIKVTGYVGTPSFFTILLDTAVEKGWVKGGELALSKAFFTAEMTPVALRQRCEELGIQVFEGYGTADCGCIAFEDKEGPGLKITSSAIVQICDPVSGELVDDGEGEVVVTLFDKSYPLIRFGTGDLSKWVEGYEGERIVGVLGRVSDGVKVKGMFVREKQLAAVLANEGYTSFQALVSSRENQDQLEITVESATELNQDLVSKLQDVIRVSPIVKRVNIGELSKREKLLVDERVRP